MKTNQSIRIMLAAGALSVLVACKKDAITSITTPATTSVQTATDDQAMASSENDGVSSDISAALSSNSSYSRISSEGMREEGDSPICDATLSFDTSGTDKVLTITYNGSNCQGNRTRKGTIVISEAKGVHWNDKGAVVNVTINNLVITRVADGKSMVVNGKKKIINTSGGLLTNLSAQSSVVHDIADTLSIACDGAGVQTWNSAKHRVFTYDNGIKMTTTGTHSDGAHTDIAEWGKSRFGVVYSDRITVAKVVSQACSTRLVSGQDTFSWGDSFTTVVTYGLDANGNPVTSCPTGKFYAKAVWTYTPTGTSGNYLFQY